MVEKLTSALWPAGGALGVARLAAAADSAMPPTKAARFPRSLRLLRHADFERVYKEGRRHFSASMTVFYLARKVEEAETRVSAPRTETRAEVPAPPGLRIGFTVGRALGGAVERNRIKRRLREAVRVSSPPSGVAADVVINPKKLLLSGDFADLRNEVSRAFAIIKQKLPRTEPEQNGAPGREERRAESRGRNRS